MTVLAINFSTALQTMLSYTGSTLLIFLVTLLIALPLGLPISMGRMSRIHIIRLPIQLLLTVVRGTPLMLQLMLFFYGPPILLGLRGLPRELTTFVAFGINYACYFAEIYRGGIQSIPIGQHEAAQALGFTKSQTFFKIILPQVVKQILPSMGNEFVTLVKDTSLARVIAYTELLSISEKLVSSSSTVIPFLIAGVLYLLMNSVVTQCFALAEKKLSYYR